MMKHPIYIFQTLAYALLLTACGHYLDLKGKSNMTTPGTLADCQELLDDDSRMNLNYPSNGEASADDYYLAGVDWNGLPTLEDRQCYQWAPDGQTALVQWQYPYQAIYNANLALQTLDHIGRNTDNGAEFDRIQGSALFFRGYAFYSLVQLFAPPYVPGEPNDSPAIPLRLSADIDVKSVRATTAQAYQQVVADLQRAATLLPVGSIIATRPDHVAALAVLARVYLAMQHYEEAGQQAQAALQLKSDLLDYNDLDTLESIPFSSRFNTEVLFHSMLTPAAQLSPDIARIDSNLIRSYAADDLRLPLFFSKGADGASFFRGSYDGTRNESQFSGLTTAELYLVRGECRARSGDVKGAMDDLNTLLLNRYKKDGFVPATASDAGQALEFILTERRKELLFRGLRWADLRRLNQETRYQVTLLRKLDGQTYSLTPDDRRYTLLLPLEVMETTSFTQNPR